MKQPAFIFITCSLLLLGCKPPVDENTQAFEKYLGRFSLRINDSAVYCLVPANQCKNCFRYDAAHVSADMNRRLVVISGFPASNFVNFDHVYYDQDNAMLQLRLLDYGNRLVICHDHRIQSVIAVSDLYTQLDSLAKAPVTR